MVHRVIEIVCDILETGHTHRYHTPEEFTMLLPILSSVEKIQSDNYQDVLHFSNSLMCQQSREKVKRRAPGQPRKSKRLRTAFTCAQLTALESCFRRRRYVEREQRADLARHLQLGDKQIKVWFQNRRMKQKREGSGAASAGSSPASSDCSGASHVDCSGSGGSDLVDFGELMKADDAHAWSPQSYPHASHAAAEQSMEQLGAAATEASLYHQNSQYTAAVYSAYEGSFDFDMQPPYFGAREASTDDYYKHTSALSTSNGNPCFYNQYPPCFEPAFSYSYDTWNY